MDFDKICVKMILALSCFKIHEEEKKTSQAASVTHFFAI